MVYFLKNIRTAGLVVLTLGMASLSAARAADPKPVESAVGGMRIIEHTLVMTLGGTEIVALPPNLQTASISLPAIVHINLVSQKVAEILAHQEGRTDVLFTGKDTIYRFHITVQHVVPR